MNNVDIKQVAKWDQEHFGILCLQRERERERREFGFNKMGLFRNVNSP